MKRFLSVLIALILVLSMFSVAAVAFAEEPNEGESQTEARVKFTDANAEQYKNLVFLPQLKKVVMSDKFMLDGKIKDGDKDVVWYKSAKFLHLFFEGINYIELADEAKGEGDVWTDSTTYNLTYNYGYDAEMEETVGADKLPQAPAEPEKYHATEHVKLAKAPQIDGYKFAGWTVSWDGCDVVEFTKFNNFPADFEFNMPAKAVTVTAKWIKLEPQTEDKGDGDAETADGEEEGDKKTEYVDVDVTFYANDAIYLMYCGPDGDYNKETKDWDYCAVDSTFNLSTEGEWWFRFAVLDGVKVSKSGYEKDQIIATTYDNVLALMEADPKWSDDYILERDYTLKLYADDQLHPVVKKSSTAIDKEEDGLTAGVKFTISYNSLLTVTDTSGWSATYEVYKKVNGEWVLIYDSTRKTGKVVDEKYADCISDSGVITPLESDVAEYTVYKIVFSVKDNYGFYGVSEDDDSQPYKPEIELKVVLPEKDPGVTPVEVWKIVLYVIAGLSAVGIVVLLFIKPKQKPVEDGRYSAETEADKADVDAEGASETDESEQE